MIRVLTFAFVCMTLFIGYASPQDINQEQLKIDSLKELNRIEKDQYRLVDICNEIALTYGIISIDSSLVYSERAKILAEQLDYTHGLAISHSYIARASSQIGEMKKALENFDLALELFIREADSVHILDVYRGMSYVVSYSGNQLASLNYNRKALEIAEKLKDTTSLSVIYNNIAAIYKRLDNCESAISYFEKSIAIEKNPSPQDVAITYSNIGVLKVEKGKLAEAKDNYQKIQELLPEITNPYVVAYLYLSLSAYNAEIGEFKSSEQYLAKANQICSEHNYQHIQAKVYQQYGELYFKEKQYKKSIYYFDKSIDISERIDVRVEYPLIYKMRAEAYAQLGQYSKAYQSLEKANVAIDSLKTKKVASFLDEFESQRAKDELSQQKLKLILREQKAENETIKIRNRFVVAIATIVLLLMGIGLGGYFFVKIRNNNALLKNQHKQIHQHKIWLEESIQKLKINEQSLKKVNATKDKFFSIIAHDLRSPFNAILGFNDELTLNYDQYNDEERKEMIKHIGDASKSTYSLLDNLLAWSQSQSGAIKLDKRAYPMKHLVDESISPNLAAAAIKKIQVLNNIDDNVFVWVDKETIKVVISNLFNNAIKFCDEGGSIYLTNTLNENMIEICIRDTGIGMSKQLLDGLFKIEENVQRKGTNNEKGTGLGLILCQEFVQKNNGRIWAKSTVDVGSELYFSLPLDRNS